MAGAVGAVVAMTSTGAAPNCWLRETFELKSSDIPENTPKTVQNSKQLQSNNSEKRQAINA